MVFPIDIWYFKPLHKPMYATDNDKIDRYWNNWFLVSGCASNGSPWELNRGGN